jgi:protein TonB
MICSKKCGNDKISSFVLNKFNTRMAGYCEPEVKEVRITVLFKIKEHGKIGNIMARAPHPKLEQETIRIAEFTTDMTKPGMPDETSNSNAYASNSFCYEKTI